MVKDVDLLHITGDRGHKFLLRLELDTLCLVLNFFLFKLGSQAIDLGLILSDLYLIFLYDFICIL